MDNGLIFGIALTAGLSVGMVVWLISRLVSDVPADDRTWRDPPPLGFRLIWWPILWVSYYIGFMLSEKRLEQVTAKLRVAGLDYALTALQFESARIVGAFLFPMMLYWIMDSLHVFHIVGLIGGGLLGFAYPKIWLIDTIKLRRHQMIKTLPFYLDVITLAVESGLNLNGALQQAVSKGPAGVLQQEFSRVLRDIRAGSSRAESLRSMGARLNHTAVTSLISTLIQAEATGMSLGPILRAQADQRRTERFVAAEKVAMEAPVKMLLPLIAFIFPCVFLILLFPIVMKFMTQGF